MSILRDTLAVELPALKDDLGDSVTYTHKAGGSEAIVGIISDTVREGTFPGKNMAIKVFLADLSAAPVQGDTVTYNASTFTVVDVKTGNGVIALLSLKKNA